MPSTSRSDLWVSNESTALLIGARSLTEGELYPDDQRWRRLVKRAELVPIELCQDDRVVVRVVADGALTEAEEAAWVGEVRVSLQLADGRLVLSGGIDTGRAVGRDVGEGAWIARILAYPWGVNGSVLLSDDEPLEAYWRRTRKRRKPPAWVTEAVDGPALVDFVVHLTRPGEQAAPKPPKLRDGVVSFDAFTTRRPEVCPTGEGLESEAIEPDAPAEVDDAPRDYTHLVIADLARRAGATVHQGVAGWFRKIVLDAARPHDAPKHRGFDRELAALRYQPFGDLLPQQPGDVILRGYARVDGTTCALLRSRLVECCVELATFFADGSSVLTRGEHATAELHARHDAAVQAHGGAPVPAPSDLASLARALDRPPT